MDKWDDQMEPNFIIIDSDETEDSPHEETEGNAENNIENNIENVANVTIEESNLGHGDQFGEQPHFHEKPETLGLPNKNKPKKEPKYITRKAFVLTLILCMILTSVVTAGGLVVLSRTNIIPTEKTISATNYTIEKATGSEKTIEEIVAMNENAVVEIRTESVANDMWMQQYVTQGAGSGVIVDTKGYILTCNHVVEGARKITVILKDGKEYTAKLIGAKASNDIAVLKINAKNLTAATYGDSNELSVGDLAVAIGNPLGKLGGTASQGIISSLDRKLNVDNKELTLLQTDASINPGNSGGGLFNQYGQLVGIVVAKSSGSDVEGLGFAIPVSQAAPIAKDIIKNGNSISENDTPIIGIQIIDIQDPQTAMQYNVKLTGVYIADVSTDIAKRAGFKSGDLIYYVEKDKIENADDLTKALSKHKVGDTITITIVRENKAINLKTKLQSSDVQ